MAMTRVAKMDATAVVVKRAEQCGIIKFGSRIDMYFPLDADIKVKVGDLTRACETVIAELR